jgi:phosphoglycolate phosphatase-like HAD superfamily hydrolase
MTKKTVLAFDFDGTIANSVYLEKYTIFTTAEKFMDAKTLAAFDKSHVEKYYGPTEKGIIKKLVPKESFPAAWDYFIKLYNEQSRIMMPKPFDGIKGLLNKYSQRKDVLVVMLTGRSPETLAISLKDLGLEPYFAKCYTGAMTGVNKDKSILKLLHDYGLNKNDVLYIGDTVADIKVMRKVNVDLISAVYGYPKDYQDSIDKLNPSLVAHTVQELDELLKKATH